MPLGSSWKKVYGGFGSRCFGNVTYDLVRLDKEMARRIARRLCEHGGRDGFELGRKILDLVKD